MITGGSKALSSIRTLRRHNNHENTIEQYSLFGWHDIVGYEKKIIPKIWRWQKTKLNGSFRT